MEISVRYVHSSASADEAEIFNTIGTFVYKNFSKTKSYFWSIYHVGFRTIAHPDVKEQLRGITGGFIA